MGMFSSTTTLRLPISSVCDARKNLAGIAYTLTSSLLVRVALSLYMVG